MYTSCLVAGKSGRVVELLPHAAHVVEGTKTGKNGSKGGGGEGKKRKKGGSKTSKSGRSGATSAATSSQSGATSVGVNQSTLRR